VSLPSWPLKLDPQAHTVLSPRKAKLKSPPPATAVTPESPGTWTGVEEVMVVLLPNWPEALLPHAATVQVLVLVQPPGGGGGGGGGDVPD
jgi:hypothetical protein